MNYAGGRDVIFRWAVLVLIYCSWSFFAEARQPGCPPDWPPPGLPTDLPCPEEHKETLQQEHEDRINRLNRLSAGSYKPTFSTEFLSPDEHRLNDYPVNIPVLRVFFDTNAFFDTGESEVKTDAFPILRIIANNLEREPPDVALYVGGHTDSRGGDDYNYNLGLSRANAVAEALARRGIYRASIHRLSFGEKFPIADNDTPEGQARNRRVEFLFAATPQAAETFIRRIAVTPCIAKDENGVQTCRRPVTIEVKKVAVSIDNIREVAELNREEEAIEFDRTLSPQEKQARRAEIELRRERIPITLERERIAVDLSRSRPQAEALADVE